MSLLMKKIGEDLDYLKKSLDIVRENPQYMANEILSKALLELDGYKFKEAQIFNFKIYMISIFVYRRCVILKRLNMKQLKVSTCHLHFKEPFPVSRSRYFQV